MFVFFCILCQGRAVLVDMEDGFAINRIELLINWSKRYYDNKSGASLEAVVRNMCACDSLLRNHYSGYIYIYIYIYICAFCVCVCVCECCLSSALLYASVC